MRHKGLYIVAALGILGALAFAALVILRIFFINQHVIPHTGMYPTLPAGSIFFTRKCPYADASEVRRGDIITFLRKEHGPEYIDVWRVVALPGEKVETSGDALTINGQPAVREKLRETSSAAIFREQIGGVSYEIALDLSPRHAPANTSLTVPAGTFFVMGDNRFNARDSRSFGPVPFEAIIGRKL